MRRLLPILSGTLLLLAAWSGTADAPGYDLVVRGGRVVDGTGNPAFFGDVAVKDGHIAEVGAVPGRGREEVDVDGQVVAPGFIDVHTHAENVESLPLAESFVRMGVTSVVTGNCGGSKLDVAAFFRSLEQKPASINVATLVGHNTVREEAMGGSFDRPPTADELAHMQGLVWGAMADGAVGLSTGLIYLPGTFSKTEEIIALAKVASVHDGIYASHIRNEGNGIRTALDELFQVAREARIRAQVSHLKLGGKAAWGRAEEVLGAIERARADGLDVTQDQYVYTASSTGISQMIPSEAREGSREQFLARIADPAQKAKIAAQMRESLRARGQESYDYAVIASYRADPSLNGKNLVEAARLKRGSDSLADQIELILEIQANGGASGVFHGMSEADLTTFLRHPNTMVAADSGVRRFGEGVPHPRGYGNNARVLARYVREQKVLRLEDAVRKMTSLPAGTFRLRDRGLLRPGARADLVVFDPARVQDRATYQAPHAYPDGIPYVWVNGVAVVRRGEHTGARPGMPLRHAEKKLPETLSRRLSPRSNE
ncbi:MAG: N-acyl-D-amino-acid deacylase family protein [Armatimonadota bacterium]